MPDIVNPSFVYQSRVLARQPRRLSALASRRRREIALASCSSALNQHASNRLLATVALQLVHRVDRDVVLGVVIRVRHDPDFVASPAKPNPRRGAPAPTFSPASDSDGAGTEPT